MSHRVGRVSFVITGRGADGGEEVLVYGGRGPLEFTQAGVFDSDGNCWLRLASGLWLTGDGSRRLAYVRVQACDERAAAGGG